MDRHPDLLLQDLDQPARRVGLEKPRHVLDREQVGSPIHEVSRQLDVILEGVSFARRVEDVARVADRGLGDRPALSHGIHGHLHLLGPVQRIEDAKEVDPAILRLEDELAYDVVGIGRVADRIRAAQQHLEEDVRDRRAKLIESRPGVLVEKAHRDVEGRPAPHLEREELRGLAGQGGRDREHVLGPQSRRQQRLMRVAKGRVRHQHRLVARHPGDEALGAELLEALLRAGRRRRLAVEARDMRLAVERIGIESLDVRLAVHRDVAEVLEQPRPDARDRPRIATAPGSRR